MGGFSLNLGNKQFMDRRTVG